MRQSQRERVKIHCWSGRKQAAEPGAKSPLFPFSHFSDRLLLLPSPPTGAQSVRVFRQSPSRWVLIWCSVYQCECGLDIWAKLEKRERKKNVNTKQGRKRKGKVLRESCTFSPKASNRMREGETSKAHEMFRNPPMTLQKHYFIPVSLPDSEIGTVTHILAKNRCPIQSNK